MTKTPFGVLFLLAAAHLAAPIATAATYGPDLDLDQRVWKTIQEPHNTSISIQNDSNGSLYFDWPTSASNCVSGTCISMNYLTTTHVPSSIVGALVITVNVQTTGAPVFHFFSSGGIPPSVRGFVWAHQGNSATNSRWWADDVYYDFSQGAGTMTMAIPIDPHNFSNVDGHRGDEDAGTLAGFNSAMADVYSLGVTFGGGSNFGHGIYVTGGTARFTLQDYNVVPACPSVSPCPGLPGSDCTRGKETSATSAGFSQCVQTDGSLLDCGSLTVNTISTTCQRSACCETNPPTCTCLPSCGGGSYLECR